MLSKKARAAVCALPEPVSMMFFVVENNGGGYHWTIVAGGGETLVRSASFASYEEAKRAAGMVRDGAAGRDALDADRWLDEGGSSAPRR